MYPCTCTNLSLKLNRLADQQYLNKTINMQKKENNQVGQSHENYTGNLSYTNLQNLKFTFHFSLLKLQL